MSEVVIQFRAVPHQSFPVEATLDWQPARLIMSIQPDEASYCAFRPSIPGRRWYCNLSTCASTIAKASPRHRRKPM
ncbi:MAG: hypothetical protein WDO73_31425 [Ignavibacteriota bacterium]